MLLRLTPGRLYLLHMEKGLQMVVPLLGAPLKTVLESNRVKELGLLAELCRA